jgi:hypothetical protein
LITAPLLAADSIDEHTAEQTSRHIERLMFFECSRCTDTTYRRGVRTLVAALGDGRLATQLLQANEQQRLMIIRTFIAV